MNSFEVTVFQNSVCPFDKVFLAVQRNMRIGYKEPRCGVPEHERRAEPKQ